MYAKRGTGKKQIICETCGKKLIVWDYEIRNGRKFCGRKCKRHSLSTKEKIRKKILGTHTHTQEWKEELRQKMIGNQFGFKKGRPSVFRGKKRKNLSGENHWNWKGGTSPINQKIRQSLEYKLWEGSVLGKDNYLCQKCSENRINKLVAHHIRDFAEVIELRTSIENGITFCRTCHKEFHRRYGKKNNTKEQIEEFCKTN
jgi:endogenous inhibitor of DNA gyrase (YacG/DUF329 family)